MCVSVLFVKRSRVKNKLPSSKNNFWGKKKRHGPFRSPERRFGILYAFRHLYLVKKPDILLLKTWHTSPCSVSLSLHKKLSFDWLKNLRPGCIYLKPSQGMAFHYGQNGMCYSILAGMKHFTLEWHIPFRPEWNEAFHSGQNGKTHFNFYCNGTIVN